MLTREQAEVLSARILGFSGFPECAVAVEDREELNLRFANNSVTTSGLTSVRNVVISSTRDRKTGTVSVEEVGDDALRAAVKRSEALAALAPEDPEHMEPLGKQQYPALDHFDEATAASRSPQFIPQVKAIVDAAGKSGLVAAGFFIRTASAQAIANKAGLFGYSRATSANLSTTVRTPDGTSSGWAGQPGVRLSDIYGARLAARAIHKCLQWRKPVRLAPGKYTVVLEPAAACNLVGLIGFDARTAELGQSYLSKKGGGTLLGEKLFPSFITLRNDPFDARLASSPWDAGDWIPARKIDWIENGVVQNLSYGRYWAKRSGKEPTPSPSSLVMGGGQGTADDLVRTVDRGLLVTRTWYLRVVNPQTLQVTGLTRDGLFLIENGHIAGPVMNFRFNESPVRLLQNARRLGTPVCASSFEGGVMVVPPIVATGFTFTSVSDAV